MTECELQNKISKDLKTILKIKKIRKQVGYLSGISDIIITLANLDKVAIEVKLRPNKVIIHQLLKQKLYYKHLIAFTKKPFNVKTVHKWRREAKINNINLFFYGDNIKNIDFDNLTKNPFYDAKFSRRVLNG